MEQMTIWDLNISYNNEPVSDSFIRALMMCDFDDQDSVDMFIDCQTDEEYDAFSDLMAEVLVC